MVVSHPLRNSHRIIKTRDKKEKQQKYTERQTYRDKKADFRIYYLCHRPRLKKVY